MSPSTTTLQAALGYAKSGWPVFPCDPATKQPYTPNGFKAATTHAPQIESWWSNFPNAMIGVPTGPVSGIWVLDLDLKPGADGAAALADLEARNGKVPPTLTAVTPSGGKHLYFRYVDGVRNRGRLEPGIDVRGEGGYVIAPGSARDDGCVYDWETPGEGIAGAPPWLIERVMRQIQPRSSLQNRVSNPAYSTAAIARELQKLIGTTVNRNNQLNDSAMAIGQFVGAGELTREEADHCLFGAAVANGYVRKDGERATRATIKSGLDAGERQPRAIPAPLNDGLPDGDGAWIDRSGTKALPKAANDNERDDTIDAKSLLAKHFEEMRYIIPRYVPEGLTILAGKPKLGKSWMAYNFAVAVATGGCAMGNIECKQGDVLYLALEDNQRRAKSRIQTVMPTDGAEGLERLTMKFTARLVNDGLLDELDQWRTNSTNPSLIIVDVLAKVKPPQKRNQGGYAADYDAITPLQRYASEHRLAIVVITHTRKQEAEDNLETVSGTNGLTGSADSVLVLTRGPSGSVLYGRGRDIEEIETSMRFDGGKWTILGNADEVRRSDQRRDILATLKENGEMKPAQIAKEVGAKSDNVRQLLRKMVAAGEVSQPRTGFYSAMFKPVAEAA